MTLAPAGAPPLRLGPVETRTPVVLAPMAGVTDAAYRQLCREHGEGLYVCEMVTSRGVAEREPRALAMLARDPGAAVFSVQLFGVHPATMGRAVDVLCAEHGVGHVDLNFGCPVPKVTRKGGGAALPWKRGLFADLVRSAVTAAMPYGVPVTVKTRLGIDAAHLTYRDAGRIAEDEGAAAVALHARTAAQHYSGSADWDAVADLVDRLGIPVLGNGDVWEAADALRLVEQTGCAGVVVGRGCLGRPWLFAELEAAFAGRPAPPLPDLEAVARTLRRHAALLAHLHGEERGCRELRKHVAWYLKGFAVGGDLRRALGLVATLAELDDLLARLDLDQPFPVSALGVPRGRQGAPRSSVALPEGWLADHDGRGLSCGDLAAAELDTSGG